jgi:acetyl esterase/lipase
VDDRAFVHLSMIARRRRPILRRRAQISGARLDAMAGRGAPGGRCRSGTPDGLMQSSAPADIACMPRSRARIATAVSVAAVGLFGLHAPQADAALPFRLPSLFQPKPKPVPVIPPVAAPMTSDPAGGVAQGTVIMVHAGGWAGHDGHAQEQLMTSPGNLFRERGWRVVSIDYDDGVDGLQDVLDAAGAELARGTGDGPLCIYGESSGAHLALVAAARLRAVDCVIGLGTPTDLSLYEAEGSVSSDARVRQVAGQITKFFGTTMEQTAPWNLVSLASSIHADVLLIHEADDTVVPPIHALRFQAARPTTQVVALEPGDPNDPSTDFMHSTVSAIGRQHYESAIGAFADRAVAAREAERSATRTGCSLVNRSLGEIGLPGLQTGLRCLARKDAEALRAGTGGWQQTSVKMRGEVNAARIWSDLRGTRSGRRALAAAAERRAKVLVQTSDRSRVTLRATRTRRGRAPERS